MACIGNYVQPAGLYSSLQSHFVGNSYNLLYYPDETSAHLPSPPPSPPDFEEGGDTSGEYSESNDDRDDLDPADTHSVHHAYQPFEPYDPEDRPSLAGGGKKEKERKKGGKVKRETEAGEPKHSPTPPSPPAQTTLSRGRMARPVGEMLNDFTRETTSSISSLLRSVIVLTGPAPTRGEGDREYFLSNSRQVQQLVQSTYTRVLTREANDHEQQLFINMLSHLPDFTRVLASHPSYLRGRPFESVELAITTDRRFRSPCLRLQLKSNPRVGFNLSAADNSSALTAALRKGDSRRQAEHRTIANAYTTNYIPSSKRRRRREL